MVADLGPDMRIRAPISGSTVLAGGGGRRGLGRGVRLGAAVGGCRRHLCQIRAKTRGPGTP